MISSSVQTSAGGANQTDASDQDKEKYNLSQTIKPEKNGKEMDASATETDQSMEAVATEAHKLTKKQEIDDGTMVALETLQGPDGSVHTVAPAAEETVLVATEQGAMLFGKEIREEESVMAGEGDDRVIHEA